MADLLLIRRNQPAVKATARNVQRKVAVDGIILLIRRRQGRIARAVLRNVSAASLHEDRHVENAARDIQRRVVSENRIAGNREAVIHLIV